MPLSDPCKLVDFFFFGGERGNGHDGCMGRLILTLSAGVPDNAGHLVTTQEGFCFFSTQPVIYNILVPDLHLLTPNYSSAAHNSSAFRETFIFCVL